MAVKQTIIRSLTKPNPGNLSFAADFLFRDNYIAPWESTIAYKTGDYVAYRGVTGSRNYKIYKANKDNTGTWNIANWDELNFEDYVTQWTNYTNTNPILIEHGGVKLGDTFKNMNYSDVFNKIMYPYVKPDIMNPSQIYYEKGTTIKNTVLSFVLKQNSDFGKINKMELKNGASVLATWTTINDIPYSYTLPTANSDMNLDILLTYKDSTTRQYSGIIILRGVFFAYCNTIDASLEIDDVTIKSLMGGLIERNSDLNTTMASNATNKRIICAVPSIWSFCKSITDECGIEYIDGFKTKRVSITNSSGQVDSYWVYYSYPLGTSINNGNIKNVLFKFK